MGTARVGRYLSLNLSDIYFGVAYISNMVNSLSFMFIFHFNISKIDFVKEDGKIFAR